MTAGAFYVRARLASLILENKHMPTRPRREPTKHAHGPHYIAKAGFVLEAEINHLVSVFGEH